jgi:hypothetical protein
VDDQVVTAIAVTLVTKTIEGLAEGAKAAYSALAGVVRRKLSRTPSAVDALETAQRDPSQERLGELRAALAVAMSEDPAFADEIRRLWGLVQAAGVAGDQAVINTVSGNVEGNVVQARDVQGGISFGQ